MNASVTNGGRIERRGGACRMGRRLCGWGGIVAFLGGGAIAPGQTGRLPVASGADGMTVRMGIAPGTWQGLNRADAKAAIDAWARGVLSQRGRDVSVKITLFDDFSELRRSLESGTVDAASMLAFSPEVVPSLFFFLPGRPSAARRELEPAMESLHETPAGQQVLAVFQSERLVRQDVSCLGSTRALIQGDASSRTGRVPGELRTGSGNDVTGKAVR